MRTSSWRAALLIAGKDLRQRLRDRSAVIAAVVVPFMLAAIFALVLGGNAGDSLASFTYGVVDLDHGEVAQAFTQQVLGALEQQGVATVRSATTEADGRALAAGGKVDATFVIPAGFTQATESGQAAHLVVIGSVDSPIGTDVARAIASSYAGNLTAVQVSVGAVIAGGVVPADAPPAQIAALTQRAAAATNPVQIVDGATSRRELDLHTYFAAGMAVFFVFFTVQFGVSSILDERREGTLDRLLVAPVRRTTVLVSKVLTSLVLGVVSMAVLVAASAALLGAHWGNPVGVAMLVVAAVVAATGVTALIATIARTAEQAGNWASIVAVVLGIVGGTFFPVTSGGALLEHVSLIAPQAWFMRGLAQLAGGGGPAAALPATGAMLVFAAITGGIAVARAGRLVQR